MSVVSSGENNVFM